MIAWGISVAYGVSFTGLTVLVHDSSECIRFRTH